MANRRFERFEYRRVLAFQGVRGRFKGSEYLKFSAAVQEISEAGISSTLTP